MPFSDVQKISLVVPVYNEEGSVGSLWNEIVVTSERIAPVVVEAIFVDDGSLDRSREILLDLAKMDSRCKVVCLQKNYGQTAAMSCGIKLATGDVIIPMDADLQNDPNDIPRFLEKVTEGYTCVSGWRKNRKDDLILRKIPSWVANGIISWMTGVHLHDYGCSMKAYRRDIIQGVELYGEMHRFIPSYAAWSGAKVTEIVVNHRARVHGVSKYGISRIFKVVLDLVVVKFLMNWFNKPMHFFGAVGFLSLFLGVAAEVIAVILKLTIQRGFVQTPLPVIGAMFIIVGVQCVLFGLIAEVQMRTYYEGQSKTPYRISRVENISMSTL